MLYNPLTLFFLSLSVSRWSASFPSAWYPIWLRTKWSNKFVIISPRNSKKEGAQILLSKEIYNRVLSPYCKLRILFLSPFGLSRAGLKSTGKKRGSVTCGTDREDEVSKIFIISLLCDGFGNDFCSRGTASNFWPTSKAKPVNFKSLVKSPRQTIAKFRHSIS